MAEKKDKYGNTMADYDRWGTPRGVTKPLNKPTAAQRKLADQINAERAAAKGKAKKK